MREDFLAKGAISSMQEHANKPLNRRQIIRSFVQTGVALGAGGALLSACGGESNGTTAAAEPVTLTLTDTGAFKPSLLSSKTKPTDPDDVAELEKIQNWLAKNKNVTIKASAVALDDDQKKQATIAARTAPALIPAFGNQSLNRAAPKLGYIADVTSLYQKYNYDNLLADYAKPFWASYNLQGKYFALPGDGLAAGAGLYYRRDLLKAQGVEEPQAGWNWDDLFGLLRKFQKNKKPVMGVPGYWFGYYFNSNMLDRHPDGVLGSIPAPKKAWHWEVKVDPWVEEWKEITNKYRNVVQQEKLIDQNPTVYAWEGVSMSKIADGTFPFSPGFAFQGTITGYAPVTPADAPKKFNKTFDELFGFRSYPKGSNGAINSSVYAQLSGVMMLPKYVKGQALERAVDLYTYGIYGDGYVQKYAQKYALTKSEQQAYKFVAPANKYQKNPKLPANVTVESAYGPLWVKSYMDAITNLKPIPTMSYYYPSDKQTGPAPSTHDDLLSRLSTGTGDITAALKTFESTYNQQGSTLQSDISAEDFTASTKEYLSALDSFFKENTPDFHAGDWTKYYNTYALPALS